MMVNLTTKLQEFSSTHFNIPSEPFRLLTRISHFTSLNEVVKAMASGYPFRHLYHYIGVQYALHICICQTT